MLRKYSVIIPLKCENEYINECLFHLGKISREDVEILVLPDVFFEPKCANNNVRVFETGAIGPSQKRDFGAEHAGGDYLVFFDDDCYPETDYFDVLDKVIGDSTNSSAFGGPGITPINNSFWQKVSGAVFLSKFSGGAPERYVSSGREKLVDDWPSVNLVVLRALFETVGGFNNSHWPGEDTLFCDKLRRISNEKILYVPNLIVWHHRRASWIKHLEQIGAYGLHRGYFARHYGGSSRKLMFFLPSLWTCFLVLTAFQITLVHNLHYLHLTGLACYSIALLLAYKDIIKHEKTRVAIFALLLIMLTHVFYGTKFLQGFVSPSLQSKFR